ncbi:MAG TPA: AarF/UbiB family protein [Flavobacteriaceae bacterium]|nr:AarF/UbiB family protein [Flavobacteriaceae bacterium]
MSLLPESFDKYVRFFRFILKYWNSDIFSDSEEDFEVLDIEEDPNWEHSPEELVEDLKQMGPTYVKLGQLLSTRPDMLPQPYLDALANLQDDVESVAYHEVEQLFREEIGDRISKAFKSFNKEPMASASIGQVHEAVLHSGEKVAVKIQRPGIRKRFVEDLDTLMTISEKAEQHSETARKFSLHSIIEELRYILLQELDYQKEAQNLIVLKENMKEFQYLYVPGIVPSYCSQRVLTMKFVDGTKVTSLSPFQLESIPKTEIVNDLIKGYLKQIIVDGFAHADPHPGNVNITKDHKLGLMDLGMVARFDNEMQDAILKLMIGLGNNNGDQVTETLLSISKYDEQKADIATFRRKIIRQIQANEYSEASDLKTGRAILDINKIAAQLDIHLPVELTILGKILLNMDQIIAFLSPKHQLQDTVKEYIEHLMKERMTKDLKSGHLLQTLLDSKELAESLPRRLNKISENLADNKFRLSVDAIDENRFILAFQKVANRITIGLIIAALILGAALLMRVPTTWTILGYPGFAILLFVFAASIGLYLVYQILFKDEEEER